MRKFVLACVLLTACESGAEDTSAPAEAADTNSAEATAPSADVFFYAAVPDFDARRVCDPVARNLANAEPANVDPVCYAQEVAAKKALSKMKISHSIANYCKEFASIMMGGYSKFKECADQRLANEAVLSRIEKENGS